MMKKNSDSKPARVGDSGVWHPKPHPPRKRPPKNNLGHVPYLVHALGRDFRVPGRPVFRKSLASES